MYMSWLSLTCIEVEMFTVRESLRTTKKEYAKTEDDLKSLQSVGQIIGEVLRPLDNERCNYSFLILSLAVYSLTWIVYMWKLVFS